MRRQMDQNTVVSQASQSGVTTPQQDAAFDQWLDDMDGVYEDLDALILDELAATPDNRRHQRHEHRPGRAA
jgi:hypothetical protein